MRSRGWICLLAAALIGIAGCTSSPGPAPGPSVGSIPPTSAAPLPGDRLLVIRDDGNLVTMRPDGDNVVPLTTAAGADLQVVQPAWAPDGARVAWGELDARGATEARVVVSGVDGTDRRAVTTIVPVFFLQWDPTSSRIAYLGNTFGTIGMGVVQDDGQTLEDTPLGTAAPFFISWAPGGDRLLAHLGDADLWLLELDGGVDDLRQRATSFRAPIWLPDDRFVYARREGSRLRLVIGRGEAMRMLAEFHGTVSFVASRDGARIAYRIERGADRGLYVADLHGGSPTLVTRDPVTAFFWSGDGRRLLSLVPDGDSVDSTSHWRVWDGEEIFVGPRFLPSPMLVRDYLPFFDQYAQGMTPWSPDGRAFAYAGLHDGTAGIWVQEVRPGAEPTLVSDGSFVAWSPAESRG